jgi:hypothetical protein
METTISGEIIDMRDVSERIEELEKIDAPDDDEEIDLLVDFNDASDHATVLAVLDRAIAGCE